MAITTRDLDATHDFYTEAMGFELVKAVVAPTDQPDAWAKHLFYDTGGDGLLAVWEIHDGSLGDFDPALPTGLGLPAWANHLAFTAHDVDDLHARRQHWLDQGIDVVEIDHGFCRSIYTLDPNGTMIEWCADTRVLDAKDRDAAERTRTEAQPQLETAPTPIVHRAPAPVTS